MQFFSTDTEQAEGVSTAKALAVAMAQGQRIYRLTQSNAAELANITIDDGARTEIQQALNLGLEVTVHQSPITINGWQGSGYAILDAEYGVGAYQISGGVSGGFLVAILVTALAFIAAISLISVGSVVAGVGLLFWEAWNFNNYIDQINKAKNFDDFNQANINQATIGALGLLLVPGIGGAALATIIFGIGFSWALTSI